MTELQTCVGPTVWGPPQVSTVLVHSAQSHRHRLFPKRRVQTGTVTSLQPGEEGEEGEVQSDSALRYQGPAQRIRGPHSASGAADTGTATSTGPGGGHGFSSGPPRARSALTDMLPRSLRTGGSGLPGVESSSVPLIGYRQLSPDCPAPELRSEGRSQEEVDSAQSEASMKTTWYCPLDLSTVVEEEEDGIIYSVMVTPPHSAPHSHPRAARQCQCVKAGTEEKLVLHLLLCFSRGDCSFMSIFLCTYRTFISTQRVLHILADRLEDPPGSSESSPTRQAFNNAVCSVFGAWLSEYPEDFQSLEDPSCLLRLAPLLPTAELRARLLQQAEELSERALLQHTQEPSPAPPAPPDPSGFEPLHILGFPSAVIAEQLTRIETELFVRLAPYHCLGSLWSQRDKKGREGQCWSVRATVRQFNRLTNTVLASCLWDTRLRSHQRAQLLDKWIRVAQACRARKNFSSLYAIVSALQSNPLHRLRRSWAHMDKESVKKYEELSEIFSDKDNYSQSRELLKEEISSSSTVLEQRLNHRNSPRTSAQGTVPYLGLFLTDLTMLDTAVKDRLDNGYVNFDKRRREFEVLAHIRLLQSSCKKCSFHREPAFVHWYQSVPELTEADSYRLSNQIEAMGEPSPRGATPTVIVTQCSDLSGSRSSLPTDSDGLFDFSSPVNHLLSKLTKHMRSPSVSCLDVDSSPPAADPGPTLSPSSPSKSHRRSASCGNNPPGGPHSSGPDMRIIRIRMELQDGNLYRSILVTSNDKTPVVISSALEKHNQDPRESGLYQLLQLLPDGKELLIPPTGNVFYAMTSSSVDFLLKRKAGTAPPQPISTETSATFPRIKAKGRRLVRTLF
uniref:Ral guanine nucleotide dissociation stimulator-like 2 n=1 Tax=Knipowitschia caucasica TaxID=637954 RepID=A0AAV2MF91_KNICA